MIALELGTSSRLVAYLRKGEQVVVMGPTGTPTEIPREPERAAARRRARQCGAVLDCEGDARAMATG